MLDIRATHYVSPLSEVAFASVPLTVHLVNVADETGLVTGTFRVYNGSTGLLIHSSDIIPLSLAGGATVDASALTDFDPPAPADDTYIVAFDGHASNALVPNGINLALGAFYFDVKPVGMGPAPAAHHATHEDGGSDEIEVADMGTAELDDTLVMQPDGAGGVEWAAVPAGVTDHGALTGLADDDHPQYRLRGELFFENDFLYVNGTSAFSSYPYSLAALGGPVGSWASSTPEANHPGVGRITSSTGGNSGYYILVSTMGLLLAGSEKTDCILRPQTLAGTTIRFGLHDASSITAPTDGCYIEMDPGTALITGKTSDNSVRSTTGTSFQIVTNTWYRWRVVVNSDATLVTFYCFAEDGTVLWTDSLATNIPTGAGRFVGQGIVATNSGTTAVALVDVDAMITHFARVLVR